MPNSINVQRSHLIMGLCLPLAVLLGYFLAQPLEWGSIGVVVLVLSLLCVPLFMKWHHPLLVLCWNATAYPLFLPGRPSIWLIMALISLFFAVLARAINPRRAFARVPSITKALIFLTVVVLVTAFLTGGIGIRSLGSARHGGKAYIYVLGAIGGYFALTSHRIPIHRAGFYIGMFFLSGLTCLIGDLAFSGGSKLSFLLYIFPPDPVMEQMADGLTAPASMVRLGALSMGGTALYAWVLARHGVGGIFVPSRPWRLILVLIAFGGCLISGFRSSLILFFLTFACVFCLEGLHRTRLLPILAALGLLTAAIVLPQAERLPLMAQRALSFLPAVRVDPIAKHSAEGSTEWRVEMWKQVLPQVPKYLLKGKGYVIDPSDLFMAVQSAQRGFGIQAAGSLAAGDYHNGPLSVLIPFGIFGLIAFIWLVTAGVRLLYYYYRYGDPALQRINTFLLSTFIAKIVVFAFVFGSLYSDLFTFTGIIGLGVSLNGPPEPCLEPELEPHALTVFSQRVY